MPSRASSVAEVPAERAICAPLPGMISMQWIVEPTGMLRIGRVLPTRIGACEPETICVVATPSDVIAIDRGGHFRGRYHVLHGLLSPLEGIGPDDIRVAELVRRLDGTVREVIIATSPSVDGEATAMYVARVIKPLGVKVSRIATGLPVGGELEYSDQATIARALAGRAPL